MEVEVKTRYSSKSAKAKIRQEDDIIRIVFNEPQRAITSGQSAVFYLRKYSFRRRKNTLKLIL